MAKTCEQTVLGRVAGDGTGRADAKTGMENVHARAAPDGNVDGEKKAVAH